MTLGLTTEILLWAAQANQSASHLMSRSPNLSDLIVLLYLITFLANKKGRFIAAFLLCEAFGNTYNYTSSGGYEIFLGYAFIYCLLYWSLVIDKAQLKTQCSCGIMVAFEGRMTLDAIYNSEVETYIYTNYEYITLFIHLYIISSLLPWSRIRRGLVDYFRAMHDIIRYSDGVAYLCYNCRTFKNQAA